MLAHTIRVAAMEEPSSRDFALRSVLRNNKVDLDIKFGIGDGIASPVASFASFASENTRRTPRGEYSKPGSKILINGA